MAAVPVAVVSPVGVSRADARTGSSHSRYSGYRNSGLSPKLNSASLQPAFLPARATESTSSGVIVWIFESPDSRAKVLDQQLVFELYGYPSDWLERYRAAIEAVTTDAVRQVAARHVHPDQFTILVVGPAETNDPSLAPFGKATPLALPDIATGH